MAVFYGCMALFVFGFIILTRPSSVATNEARDGQTWSAGLQGERMDRNAPPVRRIRFGRSSRPCTRWAVSRGPKKSPTPSCSCVLTIRVL